MEVGFRGVWTCALCGLECTWTAEVDATAPLDRRATRVRCMEIAAEAHGAECEGVLEERSEFRQALLDVYEGRR